MVVARKMIGDNASLEDALSGNETCTDHYFDCDEVGHINSI